MRPVPATKHVLAVTIFLAVSVASGYYAWRSDRISEEQVSFAAAALKRHDATLLKYDSVFGNVFVDGQLRKLQTPVFLAIMDLALIPTQTEDPLLAFRVLVAPMTLIFLCGMYALVWRQAHSSTLAAFVAALSMTVVLTFGDWAWGVGTLSTVTPAGLVVALSPWVLLSFVRNLHRPQIMLTFAGLGLVANLHLVAATNLALVLMLAYLVRHRLRRRALLTALGNAAFFVIGSAPYLLYFVVMRHGIAMAAGAPTDLPAATVSEALRMGDLAVLYPGLLKGLLAWGAYPLVLALVSAMMLWRIERFRARQTEVWIEISLSALFVSLGLHGVSQAIGHATGQTPPYIDLVQAAVWVMPALYMLFAQAITHLFRMLRKQRGVLKWVLALFMVVWMLPSPNLRLARHDLYYLAGGILPEAHTPQRIVEIDDDQRQQAELLAIAEWARTQTPRDSVFLTDQAEFRMFGQRSLYVCREDIRHFYYLAPWLLPEWVSMLRSQYRWMYHSAGKAEMVTGVHKLASTRAYRGVPAWYTILRVRSQADVSALEELSVPGSGQFFRVYRIP